MAVQVKYNILCDLIVDGSLAVKKFDNSIGDFLTVDSTGTGPGPKLINKRTSAQVLADINAEPKFTKKSGFNKNYGTAAGTVAQGNDSRINNGQTAFSWGDHSSVGYGLEPRTIVVSSTAIGLSLDAPRTILFSTNSSGISVIIPDAALHLGKEITLTTTSANPVQITSYDSRVEQMFYKNSVQLTRSGYYSVTVISDGTYWVVTSFINI